MPVFFKTKNLEKITPNEAKLLEIEHVNELMESFECSRLCDKIGRQIVAEYGFKGTKDVVWEKLSEYGESLMDMEFTQDDLNVMIERKKVLIGFDHTESNCHVDIKKAIKEQNLDALVKVGSLVLEGNQLMHDQGMCLCFHNN